MIISRSFLFVSEIIFYRKRVKNTFDNVFFLYFARRMFQKYYMNYQVISNLSKCEYSVKKN